MGDWLRSRPQTCVTADTRQATVLTSDVIAALMVV